MISIESYALRESPSGVFVNKEDPRNGVVGGHIVLAENMLDAVGGENCVAFGLINEGG